jgi:hypothetical protein
MKLLLPVEWCRNRGAAAHQRTVLADLVRSWIWGSRDDRRYPAEASGEPQQAVAVAAAQQHPRHQLLATASLYRAVS